MRSRAAASSPYTTPLDPEMAAEAEELRGWVARSNLTTITANDGTRLAARGWEVGRGKEEKGAVLIVHGFGEHTARYPHVARQLVRNGFRVIGVDLRGHGQSGGARGQLSSYCAFLDDLSVIADEVGLGQGWFLYAHSLGAQIAINWLTISRPAINGAILLSPWLRLARNPSVLKLVAARILTGIAPRYTQRTGLGNAHLSRDPAFIRSLPGQPLNHRRMSARMYTECASGASRAQKIGAEISLPVFMAHGEADTLTSAKATAELGSRMTRSDQITRIVPEARHELHNEIDRQVFLEEITTWMNERVA